MKIILIGNYVLDKQESMQRFAQVLCSGFKDAGYDCEIWSPSLVFGRLVKSSESGLTKWIGYLDKWIIFPLILWWRLRNRELQSANTRFHICDHSNSPYLRHLPKAHTGITCHDVIAIRGALGYADAAATSSATGKILQKWILSKLKKATLLACDTHLTLSQLNSLVPNEARGDKEWRVIHLGFNDEFRPLDVNERSALLLQAKINPQTPFILHVGSGHPRKNRKLLIDMAAALGDKWNGKICYAGQGVDQELLSHAESLGLRERIISVAGPTHMMLLALYSGCEAFIFPSLSEGFGWPPIEAQACGAPVIASNIEPMPEVSNGSALHADPTKPAEFAEAFLKLQDEAFKRDVIKRGMENILRFEPSRMINSYLALHGLKPKH
jgi:glycosyltransferase involved in cell wall biosynthesis